MLQHDPKDGFPNGWRNHLEERMLPIEPEVFDLGMRSRSPMSKQQFGVTPRQEMAEMLDRRPLLVEASPLEALSEEPDVLSVITDDRRVQVISDDEGHHSLALLAPPTG
jgi:hypothetical protein